MESTMVHITKIQVGDTIDLFADQYADPDGALEFEYAIVSSIDRETPDCIAIGFEGLDVFGFPANWFLRRVKKNRL